VYWPVAGYALAARATEADLVDHPDFEQELRRLRRDLRRHRAGDCRTDRLLHQATTINIKGESYRL
jgi:hypothetical protein